MASKGNSPLFSIEDRSALNKSEDCFRSSTGYFNQPVARIQFDSDPLIVCFVGS